MSDRPALLTPPMHTEANQPFCSFYQTAVMTKKEDVAASVLN